METRCVESHSGELSIWKKKTLAQNEYHIYRQNPMINSKIKLKVWLVWWLMKSLAQN